MGSARHHPCSTPLMASSTDGPPMDTAIKTLLASLAALVAVSGVASAQTVVCPECDEDVPANDDCRYASVDTGYVSENVTQLVDTDLCVAEAGDERGFWAVFSLCLTTLLQGLNEAVGVFANVELFVSEEGADLDATVTTPEGTVDFDESPLGDLDGMTWEALEGHTPEARPVGGDALPGDVLVDVCVEETDLAVCP